MYSIYELFIFSLILSSVAAFLAHKHGRYIGKKEGLVEGFKVGGKVATLTIISQLRAKGINITIGDDPCPCAECVAEREQAAKKP